MEPDASNLPSEITLSEEGFSDLPELTDEDCKDPKSKKLSTFIVARDKVLNDNEKRRLASPKARRHALAWTRYVSDFVETKTTLEEYIAAHPRLELTDEEGEPQSIEVKLSALRRRLGLYLKAYGAETIHELKVPKPEPMLLELADGRYVNPGAAFTMNDRMTLAVLGVMRDAPRAGYRKIHAILERKVVQGDFFIRELSELPTRKQIRTFLKQVPEAFRTYITRGFAKMFAKYGFARKIDYGDFNYWWAGDAFCLRDVWFYDPNRPENKRLFQPWVSFLIECASRYCVSHLPHPEAPNSLHGLFLVRDGILPKTECDFPKLAFGIPAHMLEDNRPPLGNALVKEVCDRLGIKYRPIDPKMSAQNGIAERAVQTFKNLIRIEIIARLGARYKFVSRHHPIAVSDWEIFVRIVNEAIHHVYHHRVHEELDGETPHSACMRLMTENPPEAVDQDMVIRATSFQGTAKMGKQGVTILGDQYLDKEKFDGLQGRVVEWVLDPLDRNAKAEIIYQDEHICSVPKNVPLGGPELRQAFKAPANKLAAVMTRTKRVLFDALGVIDQKTEKARGRRSPKADSDFNLPKSLGPLPNLFDNQGDA